MGDIAAQKPNGLKTALDTIISPKDAFEAIRNAPTWFWAFLISIIVAMICSYLIGPASQHALAADWPNQVAKSPQLSSMTPEQQQSALAMGQKFSSFAFIIMLIAVPIGNLISASIMTMYNALGRGDGSFGKYWAASCNIGVVSWALYSIVLAVVVMARGADSFASPQAVQQAVPSLAMLVPATSAKLATALYWLNPITLWGLILIVVAMQVVGRVPKVQAWLTAITMLVLQLAVTVPFAK